MVPSPAPTSTASDSTLTSLSTPLTQQPASFLARLATCILHTCRPLLDRIFDPTVPCDISTLSLDPDSPKPDVLITKTCHCLAYILKSAPADMSPDMIPFALVLLLKFRMVSPAVRDDLVSRDVSDETWIIVAIVLAQKFLVDYNLWLHQWTTPLRMDKKCLARAEIQFLAVLGHDLWIKDEVYVFITGRLDELWKGVYSKTARPTLPARHVGRLN